MHVQSLKEKFGVATDDHFFILILKYTFFVLNLLCNCCRRIYGNDYILEKDGGTNPFKWNK